MNERLRKIEEVADQVCQRHGLSLYDLVIKNTRKGKVVIIYITRINGVTIGDCQTVSREVGDILEMEDMFRDRYYLEVSSPGLERELRLKKHYVSAINEIVRITHHQGEKKRTDTGKLLEVLEDRIRIEVDESIVDIPLGSIKKARTYFDYKR